MRRVLLVIALLGLSACGGGDGSNEPVGEETATGDTGGATSAGPVDDAAATTTDAGATTGTEAGVLTAADGPLTETADGATLRLAVGEEVSWQLSSEWDWEEPSGAGAEVELVPVDYFDDPGFREWLVVGAAAGSATLTASGTPACGEPADCPAQEVTLTVDVTG